MTQHSADFFASLADDSNADCHPVSSHDSVWSWSVLHIFGRDVVAATIDVAQCVQEQCSQDQGFLKQETCSFPQLGMISSMRLPLVICWNGLESGDEDDNARSATLRCDALRMALAQYSSAAPIVSIVQGSLTGPLASCLALSDFIIAADANASFAVNSPTTILQATGITCKATAESRQSDFSYVAQDLADATDFARFLLSFLPSAIGTAAPVFDAPAHELTTSAQRHIRIAELIDAITDDDTPLYLGSPSDASVALGFARVYGHSVGVITPRGPRDRMLIDARALADIAAFARLCQRFSLPVISAIDEFRFAPEPLGGAAARSDSAMLHDVAALAAIQADNSQLWVHVEAAESSLIRLWANGADESMNLAQLDMMLQHLLAGHAPCAR
ncbi:MAG: hypothetical protein LKI34_06405 [Bifidobacterium tibiigranuli]|uniref:carboxyl transferase domain-containing protein n=1 Tax=Bifidobacterium tibiigranuli TaxID=2172043 RepID=UPI0026ED5E36|nr:carboxyl transferase domain-containing protein [Bifidobacterium tibiigranuli]MCI1673824.1 hypothetical protein [Bifidobacterium tibiigranuli]MCI1712073.1 hypothetical protein [Bifidobacterium tibiigranuli]MCI1833868.1 hypothetical protein [Bifidobacterium tibiigranuli]